MTTPRLEVDRSLTQERLFAAASTFFGLLAPTLSAAGSYGLLDYAVGQGARDLGVRMAMGATSGRIQRLVVVSGLRPVLVGLAVGGMMALILRRVIASLLYGIEPDDATTLAGASLLLTGVALLGCWVPARRASGLDAAAALRCE